VIKIKKGKIKQKMMEFYMNGVSITMPYSGLKITQGYLKKETKSIGIMLKRNW
jgi:hypothetical protein